MNNQFFVWLICSVAFLLVEMASPALFLFLSFSLGAFAAAGSVFWLDELSMQVVVFLTASVVSFVGLSMWLQRHEQKEPTHTNVDALKGKKGVVIKEIDGVGQVNVQGEIWSARSLHNKPLPVGTKIMVVEVRGSHVIVSQ